MALKAALGERAADIPVSSTKSAIGHLLGAAGAVEAIATVEALRRREAPPTVGWEEAEEGLDLDYVPGTAKPIENGDGPAGRDLRLVRLRRPQRRPLPQPPDGDRDRHSRAAPPSRRRRRRSSSSSALRPGQLPAAAQRRRLGPARRARDPRRRRRRRRRRGRRPAGLLLRPGPDLPRRLARRGPRRHDRPHCCGWPATPAPRWSASSAPAAPACRRATPRSPATAASSAPASSSRARCRRSRSSAASPPAAAPTRRR